VTQGYPAVAKVPEDFTSGIALRDRPMTTDMGETGAGAARGVATCGEVTKPALNTHPPYVGATGVTYVLLANITLPAEPQAAFRAMVGKRDGSDLGDGILYQRLVVGGQDEEIIGATVVTKHEWAPFEADLSRWAGRTFSIYLLTNPGRADNTSGDWGCWADLRIERAEPVLVRTLLEADGAFAREPGPFTVKGLTREELRGARGGVLHYEGCGLEGTGQYGSFALLNGIRLGSMARAGGDETRGVYAEASVPLTPEAIQSLRPLNEFQLANEGQDYFSVRRFWLELELADGRKVSSDIAAATFSQPPDWNYSSGILVPFGRNITVDLWFPQ